jgi:hypothetical protein
MKLRHKRGGCAVHAELWDLPEGATDALLRDYPSPVLVLIVDLTGDPETLGVDIEKLSLEGSWPLVQLHPSPTNPLAMTITTPEMLTVEQAEDWDLVLADPEERRALREAGYRL